MRLQVLMSVMNQTDHSIVKRSNIQSDAIVINQSNEFSQTNFKFKKNDIRFLTFNERGVGLSRNSALMRADADIVLFADDDISYINGYADVILAGFRDNPDADIIMFNVPSHNDDRPSANNTRKKRIRKFNSLRYGTYRMAAKLDRLREKNITFSLLFGGGAKYSSGEDSLFIYDSLNSKLKIFALPEVIGYVSHESSTWFKGYDTKFFQDKAVLYYYLSSKLAYLLIFQFVVRKYKDFSTDLSIRAILSIMFKAVRSVKKQIHPKVQ